MRNVRVRVCRKLLVKATHAGGMRSCVSVFEVGCAGCSLVCVNRSVYEGERASTRVSGLAGVQLCVCMDGLLSQKYGKLIGRGYGFNVRRANSTTCRRVAFTPSSGSGKSTTCGWAHL